ncbi:MAG TPA: hypothetical protein VID04_12240 [Methylomirabilota bacterium]|jgi:hypothetical protein
MAQGRPKPIVLKLTPAEVRRLIGDKKPRGRVPTLFLRVRWANGRLFITHHKKSAQGKFAPSNAAFA